jgi:hypothetical protein
MGGEMMAFVAVTVFGFKFSGTVGLIAVAVVVVVIVGVWYLATHRR